jgi:integrase/recombinase XerD
MKVKRRQRVVSYLSARQVSDMVAAADTPRDKALMAVLYQCGLRRSEVQYLRRCDWAPGAERNGVLRIWRVKAGDVVVSDEVPLWRRTSRLLNKYLKTRDDEHEPLFLSRKGVAMSPQAVYYVVRNAARKMGLPGSLSHPHVLRHSIATHCANSGVGFSDIQKHLGHKNRSSTMIYAQVLTPRKVDLAMRSEMDSRFAKW